MGQVIVKHHGGPGKCSFYSDYRELARDYGNCIT